MAITKLQPFNLDSTANYTFANITTTNANLGNAATANFFIGSGNNLSNIQGSNVTGAVANATYADSASFADTAGYASTADTAGTVTTSSQPNITSTGTLTALNVSGNANVGNLGTTNLVATGAGSFGANVNMNGNWINNVGYPSATTDVATKSYVDTMISSGISYHPPVQVATTTTLAIATGGTTAYVQPNGAGNGIGAYISTTGTYLNIDGANVQTVGTRILVKNESNAAWNGVYTYANTTAIVRSTDTDEYGPDSVEQLSINDFFFTQNGTVNKGTGFILSAPSGTITFGTSNITFSIFSTSQIYDAGTGLTLTGTTFSISSTTVTLGSYGNGDSVATFTVNSQGQLTAASNTAITANAANLTGTTLNSSVVTSSLTSLGTLGNLNVSGNANVGNLLVTTYVTSNLIPNANVTYSLGNSTNRWKDLWLSNSTLFFDTNSTMAAGTVTNGNSNISIPVANGNVTISSAGNANILVVTGTGSNIVGTLNVTGNITAGNLSATTISGAVITAAQGNITSLGTLTGLNVNGNITAANITANTGVFNGNGSGLSAIAGANVTGQVNYAATANSVAGANVSGQVGNALIASTVYTNAQPNITSVGILSSLSVSGTTNLGSVGNVTITGGTSGYVLSTNGSGVLSWVAQTGGGGSGASISNGNSNVNIATSNGNVTITAVGNTTMTITGTGANITGTANITGNVNAPFFIGNGSALTGIGGAGYIFNGTSNANIATTNGNLVVGINGTAAIATFSNLGVNVTGYMTSTGNVTGANLLGPLANGNSNVRIATSNGNVTITAVGNTTMTVTGTGANIAGYANITGNVNAPFFIGNGSALTGIGGAGYIFNGTSNANIATSGGNLNIGIGGTANVGIFTSTGLNVAGYANITGNVNAPFFIGNGYYLSGIDAAGRVVNGTSNLQILQNSNLTISVNGNANIMTVTGLGANIAGYVTATGNVSGGNISTSGQLISTLATGSAPLVVLSTTQVANLNAALAGSVTTNAQPNITSVGNLNGLIVSNSTSTVNLSNTANVTLGAVANLHISGGSANYVLKTDGSGNLDWVAVGGISVISNISNGNSNVNIATSNGNVTLTAVGNTTMTVTGTGANIAGYANITGNVTLSGANVNLGDVGNLRIAGGASSYVLSTDGASNLSWVAQSGGGGSSSAIQEFSATSNQTTFTVVGGYQVGSVLVFVNGIQMNNADYTASNGNTVVLTEPRVSGDIVRILSSMASPAININSLQNFSIAMSIALGI
jgi:hypothetical protein